MSSCCGGDNNRKAKDWSSDKTRSSNLLNMKTILGGVILMGFLIYKFII